MRLAQPYFVFSCDPLPGFGVVVFVPLPARQIAS